jgi:hypothetical protein
MPAIFRGWNNPKHSMTASGASCQSWQTGHRRADPATWFARFAVTGPFMETCEMTAEPNNLRANSDAPILTTDRLARWGRPLALATAVLFFISWVFPVGAGLSKDTGAFPIWWGPVDVGLALVLAILVIALTGLTQGKVDRRDEEASYRVYRVLIHGLLVIGLGVILAGDRITWSHCATGFAWRIWLLLYMLPAWFAAFGFQAGTKAAR